jgi:predicted nucleic acid-binding protein
MARIRAVIDTNVVFEGLTHRGGPAGVIVSAWMAELFQACISQALAYASRSSRIVSKYRR